jgi:hypothetical protein
MNLLLATAVGGEEGRLTRDLYAQPPEVGKGDSSDLDAQPPEVGKGDSSNLDAQPPEVGKGSVEESGEEG